MAGGDGIGAIVEKPDECSADYPAAGEANANCPELRRYWRLEERLLVNSLQDGGAHLTLAGRSVRGAAMSDVSTRGIRISGSDSALKQNAHGEAAGVRRFLAPFLTWRQYAANDHGIFQLYWQNTNPGPPSQGHADPGLTAIYDRRLIAE